jgi:molecular chaperone GrpE
MDPNKDIEELPEITFDDTDEGESVSVDDFIKQLEEKEKDLHITAETSVIEIAEAFEDGEIPDYLQSTIETSVQQQSMTVLPMVAPPKQDNAVAHKLEVEVAELKTTIAKMEADRDEMFKNSQRRARDFETFKARAERERKDTFQNQIGNVAMLMLPALDNLHRALDAAEHLPDEKTGPFQQFFDGIAIVSEQINDILSKMGIRPIRTIGEDFDPHYHEAVATEETDEYPANTVCGEVLQGYIAGDRVIRHSLVKVAKPLQAETPANECAATGNDVLRTPKPNSSPHKPHKELEL